MIDPNPAVPPLPLPPLPPVYDPTQPFSFQYYESPSKPRRVWTVFAAFILALLAGLLAGGIVPLFMMAFQTHGPLQNGEEFRDAIVATIQRPVVLLTSGAATQSALLLTAICAAILSPIPLFRRLRLNPSSLSPLGYVIAPVGALAVSFLFGALVAMLHIHSSGTLKLLGDSFQHLSPLELVAAILIVGVAPGFAEEFLFRGYAQTRLVQRWGRWAGVSVTALLFGIMHMDLLQGTFAVGFGIYIGYLSEKAGSIRPGMVCHAFNNSVQVVLGRFVVGSGDETPTAQAAILALVSIAVLAGCVLYIRLRVHPKADRDIGFPVLPPAEPQPVPSIV